MGSPSASTRHGLSVPCSIAAPSLAHDVLFLFGEVSHSTFPFLVLMVEVYQGAAPALPVTGRESNLGSHCGSTITMNRDEHDRQTHLRVVEPSAQRTDRTMIGWPACSHRGQVATGGGGRTTIGASSQAGRRSSGGVCHDEPSGKIASASLPNSLFAFRSKCIASLGASCSSRAVAADRSGLGNLVALTQGIVENGTRRRPVLFLRGCCPPCAGAS